MDMIYLGLAVLVFFSNAVVATSFGKPPHSR
jgi:hypothetical protein